MREVQREDAKNVSCHLEETWQASSLASREQASPAAAARRPQRTARKSERKLAVFGRCSTLSCAFSAPEGEGESLSRFRRVSAKVEESAKVVAVSYTHLRAHET